jgi:hypothetical protein
MKSLRLIHSHTLSKSVKNSLSITIYVHVYVWVPTYVHGCIYICKVEAMYLCCYLTDFIKTEKASIHN